MGFSRSLAVILLTALSLPLATAAAAVPHDWKLAVGWNGTVLPASALGTSIGAFTAPSSAAPAADAAAAAPHSLALSIGKPGGVFICENTDWSGTCGYAVQPLNECILLASPWFDSVSSFGPDPGATCFDADAAPVTRSSGNCDQDEAQWSFTFPGDDTGGMATTNPWNDQITSFACVPHS
ncbi:hypothetical protein GGX14DRAFT_481708 [Mycena pura]|uniref:Uncharacterized protein n=1 Tax=Mycena pura TaxID=153505 RepID=A0AAD6UPX7_9AGAR|nr:hypothetical protein GGX14DRAFT_481708 [Mycena pura]